MSTRSRAQNVPTPAELARVALGGCLVLLLAIFAGVSAATAAPDSWPADGEPRYYARFDAAAVPWEPAEEMNIEEVFKNWQYFAIRFEPQAGRLHVTRFERGRPVERGTWQRRPDGGIVPVQGGGS